MNITNTTELLTGHIRYLTLQILVVNLFTTFKSKTNSTFCTPSVLVTTERIIPPHSIKYLGSITEKCVCVCLCACVCVCIYIYI
jgi:hypothetical protein